MTFQNSRPINSARKFFSAIFVLLVAGCSSVAFTNTVSQSLGFNLSPDSTAQVLHFQPFDLSLGTLESVGISFDATRRHDWAIWNISGQSEDVSYADASLTGTTLSFDGTSFGFADLYYGSGNTGTLGSVTFPEFFGESLTGRTQFLAGLDAVYPSAFNPASALTNLTDLYSPLGFTADLYLSYDPGSFSISANNALAASLVDVSGFATVTYSFRTVSVPDSSLGLMVPVVLIGLLVAARRRSGMASTV